MEFNHNKHGFKSGDKAILDAEYVNSSEVFIHSITPYGMFSTVSSDGNEKDTWQVMTCRLTPIEKK